MKSMTGYGTAEGKVGNGRLFIEIKTVNHRFCDIDIKHPPKMGVLESYIKKYLENKYIRGKIDVFVKEKTHLFGGVKLAIDTELAKKYQRSLKKLSHELKISPTDEFLHYVGIDHFISVQEKEGDYSRFWNQIKALLYKACRHVDRMRSQEGSHIQKDQKKRIARLYSLIHKIHKNSAQSMKKNKEKLYMESRADEKAEPPNFSSKQDITEELTRLESHIKQYDHLIKTKGEVGRRLDFLLQEINREINTIGSKAANASTSRLVVECKTELERLREQIQNIE